MPKPSPPGSPPGSFSLSSSFNLAPGVTTPFDENELMEMADEYLRGGQLGEAETCLRQVLTRTPSHPDALYKLGSVALAGGRPDAAVRLLAKAAALRPGSADCHADLGTALLYLGREDEGLAELDRALAIKPSHAQANFNLGLHAMNAGQISVAKRHLEKAAGKNPKDPEMLIALGVVLCHEEAFAKAIAVFRRALRIAPGHPKARLDLGSALFDNGQPEEGIAVFRELLTEHPGEPLLHYQLAAALSVAGEHKEAIEHYRRAVELAPDYADAHNNLGILLRQQGRGELALSHLRIAANSRPNDPHILRNIADILVFMNRTGEARATYRRLLELTPDDKANDKEDVLAGIVGTLQYEGRFDEARQIIDEMLAANPNSVAARWLLALNGKQRAEGEEIETLERLLGEPELAGEDRAKVLFALGKVSANRGQHDAAFAHYREGNAIIDATLDYDPEGEAQAVRRTIAVCTADLFARLGGIGSPSERPVFIVGMPRSGTTLTEQIIASHPLAAGGGELSTMLDIAEDLPAFAGTGAAYPDGLAELTAAGAGRAAERYLAELEAISSDAARVTDKMPANYQCLGLIAALFPNCRVIHCRRDPRATCLSMYFQNFGGNLPYSYDLYKLGRAYRGYLELMEHWRRVLPVPILDVAYEETVADLEQSSRRIIAHCGLPWDERVLRFYETERTVRTASMWQVRQPIYDSSLAVWRNYEAYLEPLERGLAGAPA